MTDAIASAAPRIVPRSEHSISRAEISRNALKVLYRLKDAGYQAFLVGGGVRDLLLGGHPKDFDVATDALPEQVRGLFRNSRVIGRRFRLVHVRFRDEVVDVATFRGVGTEDTEAEDRKILDETGRILADNVYGNIEEDAWRRDFTINALYYNIADFSIWDFVGGMADIEARCIRLIGDPETRYREDPVRMIRAARLAAKLGLRIHADAAAPMAHLARLIDGVPPARLFDEFLKIFETGHALASFRALREHGLFEHLFPETGVWLAADRDGRRLEFLERAFAGTDERVAQGLPITPMFLFGVLLWGPISTRAEALREAQPLSPIQSLVAAALDVTNIQTARIALPRRFSVPMREMLQLQPRFENRGGRRAAMLLEHRRFRAAYDLLLLRAAVGEVPTDLAEWWTRIQALAPEERHKSLSRGGRRRRRRRSRTRDPDPAPVTPAG